MNDIQHTANPPKPALILGLGIGALLILQIIGPIAWYMGNKALKQMPVGTPRRGMVVAGKIMGIVATVLFVISMISVLFFGLIPGI